MIARRMHESLRDTAQLSFFADADAEALVAARAAWRDAGVKVGYEDLVIAALARGAAALSAVQRA
jgi:pyruvate dehydrogenase E2 component (dihydrolipoamide acetyltransferase)